MSGRECALRVGTSLPELVPQLSRHPGEGHPRGRVPRPGVSQPFLSSPPQVLVQPCPACPHPVGPMSTGTVAGLPSGVCHVRGTH